MTQRVDLRALLAGLGAFVQRLAVEGVRRARAAEEGIAEMRKHVDTMIIVPNERLLAVVGKGIPFHEALKKAAKVTPKLVSGVSGEGVNDLLRYAYSLVQDGKKQVAEEEATPDPKAWRP